MGNSWKFGSIVFYGILLVGLLVDYYFNQSIINIYLIFALTFVMFIFYSLHRLEKTQLEIEKKNYELELQKIYGGTYESLLSEVRRRQHDYKNQLGAMYGMQLTARSLEELINMQKKYGNELQLECKFDSILTCCNNSILAGFIYYKCASCEKEGVKVDYDIYIEQADCCFALHEIIEILGIFIDNAFENVKMENSLEKCIELEFKEDTEKIVFSVSNPAKYISFSEMSSIFFFRNVKHFLFQKCQAFSFSEIDKMFINGYSSKGENRGIGLGRVMELVNKYDAEVKVYNSTPYDKENWICFRIEIPK